MSKLERELAEYRELRDASRAVLMADIDHAKAEFSPKGLTSRYLGGIADGAKDVFEVAKVHAEDNRGIIALLLGAIVLWFGREPILEALDLEVVDNDAPSDSQTPESATAQTTIEDAPEPSEILAKEETLGDDNAQ